MNITRPTRELRNLPDGWRRLRLIVEYDGTNFAGWQIQAQGERTVQGVLEQAFKPLGIATRPMAAGRTDAGVHALRMPAHVDVQHQIPARNVLRALNMRLPNDVRVHEVEEAWVGFHARFSCAWRSYRYCILNAPIAHALEHNRTLWVAQALNLNAMNVATAHLVGLHDFAAFATQEERQTVREIYAAGWFQDGQTFEFRVTGESFLRHMIRGIVGTVLQVGLGKLEPEAVQQILKSKSRAHAGRNVAPHGLYFTNAGYEAWQA